MQGTYDASGIGQPPYIVFKSSQQSCDTVYYHCSSQMRRLKPRDVT